MPIPIQIAGSKVDLSSRVFESHTVVASPAAAAETIIASVTVTADLQQGLGVLLEGWAAFTVGTNGVSANMRIRQTNAAGAIIAATGALTVVAANLVAFSVNGLDAAGVLPGQVYVLTLTVGSGSAASTVSAVDLAAIVI